MKVSFPRIEVEINLDGKQPIHTYFRLTTYAGLCIKEKIGEERFNAFGDQEKWKELTERERFEIVTAFIWGMLLHAHEDLELDHVRKNLPAGEEMVAIIQKLSLAMGAAAPPVRPTRGLRTAAPKAPRGNGGTGNASTAVPQELNSGSPQPNTLN